jgi:hypothetical protein
MKRMAWSFTRSVGPNLSLNPDASPAALRAVRSAPVSLVRYTTY